MPSIKIVIPLSGCHAELQDYANYIFRYRCGELNVSNWPNCCPEANDKRIAREYAALLVQHLDVNGRVINVGEDCDNLKISSIHLIGFMAVDKLGRNDKKANDAIAGLRFLLLGLLRS